MEDMKPSKQCAHCRKPGKLECCSRCKNTYYCGRECQVAHRPEHTHLYAEDAMEKAVLRAVWLLKKLFLASASYERMRDWQWNPKRTCLSIRRQKSPGDVTRLTPDVVVTEEEREMIWAARCCKAAVAYFSRLLNILLQVNLSLQSPKKIARMQDKGLTEWYDGCEVRHVILVSSAQDKTKNWFVDLTGAKFGIGAPVHKADVYMKKWGKTVHSVAPSGYAKAQFLELGIGQSLKVFYLGIMFRQEEGVATAIENAVQTWTKLTGLPCSKLLTGSNHKYHELEPMMFKAIDEYVAKYDKAAEMAKEPPLSGYFVKDLNWEYERILQKQARDMLKYKFKGTWA